MRKRVLFVHGGGKGAYEEDRKLAASLRHSLGADYDVRRPKMPDEDSPEYGGMIAAATATQLERFSY